MKVEDFLKKKMNFSDRDLEYRPKIGYWKVLELMEEYHQEQLKLLSICAVSHRRELLKGFADFLQSDTGNLNYDFKDLVDDYLNTL